MKRGNGVLVSCGYIYPSTLALLHSQQAVDSHAIDPDFSTIYPQGLHLVLVLASLFFHVSDDPVHRRPYADLKSSAQIAAILFSLEARDTIHYMSCFPL